VYVSAYEKIDARLPAETSFRKEGKEWKGKESGRRGRREGAEAKAATPTAVNFTARQSSPHACAIVWVAVTATVTVTVIHRQSPIIPEMNFSRIRNSNIANFYYYRSPHPFECDFFRPTQLQLQKVFCLATYKKKRVYI